MTPEEQEKLMDHEYDGIQEFDNSLPLWWKYGFYFTIVFGIVYLFIFHIFETEPLSKGEYKQELQAAFDQYKELPSFMTTEADRVANVDVTFELLTDKESIEAGRKIFTGSKSLCYTCHGVNAQGMIGPNLTDDYWIHGCDPVTLAKNITTGFPLKGMGQYGSGQRMSARELNQVVSYLVSVRGSKPENPKPIDPLREFNCTPKQ